MGSLHTVEECPKCKEASTFTLDYYYKRGEEYGFCTHCGYTRNQFERNDQREARTEEHGGYGVVWKQTKKYGTEVYSLGKGERPEITEDVIFATAIIDGKITVLKEGNIRNVSEKKEEVLQSKNT